MADDQQPLRGEVEEGVADGARFQRLEPGELGHRWQRVAWGERAGGNGLPEPGGGLLPLGPGV